MSLRKVQKTDIQIYRGLIQRLHAFDEAKGIPVKKHKGDPTQKLSLEGILDIALRFGPYGSKGSQFYGTKPYDSPKQGLKLQTLRVNPHGIDLGPLQPSLPQRLFTKDKKIQLIPEVYLPELARVKSHFFEIGQETSKQKNSLLLIGRRHLRSNNSWMHNSMRLVKGPKRCTLMIHPDDANKFQIQQSELVRVLSNVGFIEIETEITEDIMPGVVSIPHGWGHHRKGIQWQVAQQYSGVSVNDLTDDQFVDQLTGNAALSGVEVKIEKINS